MMLDMPSNTFYFQIAMILIGVTALGGLLRKPMSRKDNVGNIATISYVVITFLAIFYIIFFL